MPKYHADIFTVLFSTLSSRVETWIPSDGTWEIQAPNVVRTVVSDEFLLYCTLPNGIQGERLSNCPDLDKYKRLAAGGKGSRSSGGGQKRERDGDNDDDDDIELEERARKRGPGLGANMQRTPSRSRSRSLSVSQSTRTLHTSSNSRTPSWASGSRSTSSGSRSTSSGPRSASYTLPVSEDPVFTSRTTSLISSPLANNAQGPRGERAWPGSFFAVDIITGMERMTAMLQQRHPSVNREQAFKSVFGIKHWAMSMYTKHRRIYMANQNMIQRFQAMECTPNSTWRRFEYEAKTDVVEDHSEDKHRESSVISIDDDSGEEQGDAIMVSVVEVSDEEDPESDPGSEDEGMFISDWTLMCPYCDETLPSEPSDRLKHSRILLDEKSILDCDNLDVSPNPYHRYIRPFVNTLEYCTRHRFELNLANSLRNSAWASALPVHFEDLEHRVTSLINILEDVSNYPLDNEFYQDLQRSVEATGESRAFGAIGQYSSINRTSTG